MEKAFRNIFTEENIEIIVEMVLKINKNENAAILLLKKQYSCIEKNINNILDAIENGIYTPSVKDRLLELEHQKADIETQLQLEQEKVSKLTLSKSQIRYFVSNILILLPDSKKSLIIDTFVDEIIYYDSDDERSK